METHSNVGGRIKRTFFDVSMLSSKIAYFLFYVASGSYQPYKAIFLVSVGLKVNEAAFIVGSTYIIGIIAGPCWGFLADHSGKRKLIFVLMCLGCTITVFSHPWVALKINSMEISECQGVDNSTGNTSLSTVTKNDSHNSELECIVKRTPFSSALFAGMMSLVSVTNLFLMPLWATVDSYVMNIIATKKGGISFGVQRVFGSVGYGISSFVAGVVADSYDHPKLSKYTAVFFVHLPTMLLCIPIGLWLLKQTDWNTDGQEKINDEGSPGEDGNAGTSKIKLVLKVFKNLNNVFFFLTSLINGMLTMVILNFLFLLMDDEMGSSKTAMGLAMFISLFSEVLMFPFSKKIIWLLGGNTNCMEIGLLANSLRLFITSYINNAWVSLIINILHGIGFALFWTAAIDNLQKICSKEIYNTMSCILTSVFTGCAGLIAIVGGGEIYNSYGGKTLFRVASAVGATWLLVMVAYFHIISRKRSIPSIINKQRETNEEEINLTPEEPM